MKEIQLGLQQFGYIEGQNIAFEVLSVQGRLEGLRELGAELVRHNVAVIVTDGPQSTQAAREATGTTPIVMARMDDAELKGSSPTIRGQVATSPAFRFPPAS